MISPLTLLDSLLAWADDGFDAIARRGWGSAPLAIALLSPALLVLGAFVVAPLAAAVYMSLFGGRYGAGSFVGLANYTEALTSPGFWNSFLITVYYTIGVIPAAMVLSFTVAYALHRIVRARSLFRTVYFLPYVTSAVAAAMVWRALLNPQHGVINVLFEFAGFEPQHWLLEPRGVLHLLTDGQLPESLGPSLALCCIIAFDVWHGSGFMIVVFLAGLSTIPREIEEAARIDGAGALRNIRHVVLPLLSPTVFFLAIVGTIRAFQSFNSFYALTQGGGRTLGTTENLIMHIYANFYEYGYQGYGTAVATLLSAAIVALTWAQWRFVGRRVYYT